MPKETFHNLPEDKRQLIEKVSISEFATSGYDKASITRIVDRCQIAKGSFYQYFENKLDLYLYMLKLISDLKMEYLEKLQIKLVDVDFFEYMRSLFYGGFKFARSYPRISKIAALLMKSENEELRHSVIEENQQLAIDFYKCSDN